MLEHVPYLTDLALIYVQEAEKVWIAGNTQKDITLVLRVSLVKGYVRKIYSNKKVTSYFHGTVSIIQVKILQQK